MINWKDGISCDKVSCRRTLGKLALETGSKRSHGWRAVQAGENASHSTSHLCPIHGLELDDWLNEKPKEK